MFRWRQIVGLLALVGVLLHAGLVVSHATVMLHAMLGDGDGMGAIGVICHGGKGAVASPTTPADETPRQDQRSECPICMGYGPAVTLLSEISVPKHVPHEISVRQTVVAEIIARRMAAVRPPSTGPPFSVL